MKRLFAPVDIASLVAFRIAFGTLICAEMLRYLLKGYVTTLWVKPTFHFKYYGFGWVADLPEPLIYAAWISGAVAAACFALGLFYRAAAVWLCVVQTYFFLLDETKWMNHFYLTCLLAFLAILVPCHRAFSLDAWRKPETRSDTAPAWALWILRTQMGIVYFYGGLAKITPDWLLRAEPMRIWLRGKGGLLATEAAAWTLSWGGLLLDLLIVPLLLWRRTRTAAFIVAVLFHLANSRLFTIGVFPWLAIAMTTLFLDPSWPRRLLRKERPTVPASATYTMGRGLAALLTLYFAIQFLVPLRHFLYPGNPDWTEQGHRFSWHMMLRTKASKCRYFVTHADAPEPVKVYPTDYVTDYQAMKMSGRPDMILQLAHHIGRSLEARGYRDVEVRVKTEAALNGRPAQDLIRRRTDLLQEKRSLRNYDWIVPLE